MTMPKAAVNEDNGLVSGQDDIRLTVEVPSVQPKTKSKAMERLSEVNLGLRGGRADA